MRIVFIGPPGAGKGTQARRLTHYFQIANLSTGDLLREACQNQADVGQRAASYLQTGRLVPDELVQRILFERISQPDCQRGYLLDGFPRTIPQAQALDARLADERERLDAAIHMVVTEDELLTRLALRGRADDERLVVHERLSQFDKLTRPLLEYYERQGLLQNVDAIGAQDEVFERMLAAIEAVAPGATRR